MIRTQVQLTEAQLEKLRELSASSGRSIAELIRQGVELYLSAQRVKSRTDRIDRALKVAGRFSSGLKDVSREHDRHLADAFNT